MRLVVELTEFVRAFRLTPAEARLASGLIDKDYVETAADKLGVTYETARKTLKSVLMKPTRIVRRDWLLLLRALPGPPRAGPPGQRPQRSPERGPTCDCNVTCLRAPLEVYLGLWDRSRIPGLSSGVPANSMPAASRAAFTSSSVWVRLCGIPSTTSNC